MIPFLMALMCITGLHNKTQCPTETPISNYQLHKIWDPTSAHEYKSVDKIDGGYYTNNKKPVDMSSLKGVKLRIAAIVEPPYVDAIVNGSLTGVAKIVIGVLRQALGFDYEIVKPDEDVVGIYDEAKGKWNGIIGMLAEGKADFSIQFISILKERTQAVNFSAPFGEERWVVMMKRPQETTDGDGLMAPFQTQVWWCLLIALVAMGPLCYVVVRIRCWACRGHPGLSEGYSFGHCIWFVYGALMKQGSVLKPVADSSRILFATWWIFVTILTAFYTANLTAYLTLSKIPIPYDGLHKIGYRKSWVTTKADTIQQILEAKRTPGPDYYKDDAPFPEFGNLRWAISNGRRYGMFMGNMSEMIERVRRKNELLLEEKSRVERIIYKDFRDMSRKNTVLHKRCNFIMSRVPILRSPYGFAFSPTSHVKPILDPILVKLTKSGLFEYWRREDLPVRDPCNANSDFRERQLRNGDLMTTYILCGTGYGLGFLSFVIEIIHRLLLNRKINKQLVPMTNTNSKADNLSFYKGNLTVPTGAPTFFDTDKFLKNINGRDYLVMKTADGRTKLVPKNDGLQALQPVYNPNPPLSYSYMS